MARGVSETWDKLDDFERRRIAHGVIPGIS